MEHMTVSVEFFPPKDDAGEARLWEASSALETIAPDFISVTYGAGGSTRDRTIAITKEITKRTGRGTVAHLTCVGSTKEELIEILNQYKGAGIKSILALRGDPVGGPAANWVTTDGGFDHADQLVELAISQGGFDVGVAAFPDGHPASSGNSEKDIDVLIRKEQLGATFATTQFFFESSKWESLVSKLEARGSKLPVIAGILPITNVKQLHRMAELGGTPIPEKISKLFNGISEDPDAVRKAGADLATKLCEELIALKVPGLHFYTMNTAVATLEICGNLGLSNRG
ncbi:MAG: methylenetetrahydrofolate reductase [Actinobacteria bacterium]|nr:methylenetetrahydrofolate reductase [Actinomycetota bacterium]MDA2981238.1 methylenetetrahydrofolate reductase [Actinomycetota bacterium]MDA2996160.1 methylenetetrahydrofolate reductase [Actinomycetota bacterium]